MIKVHRVPVECSAIKGTPITPSSRLRENQRRKKGGKLRKESKVRKDQSKTTSSAHKRMIHSWTHSICGVLNKTCNQGNMELEGVNELLPLTETLWAVDGLSGGGSFLWLFRSNTWTILQCMAPCCKCMARTSWTQLFKMRKENFKMKLRRDGRWMCLWEKLGEGI